MAERVASNLNDDDEDGAFKKPQKYGLIKPEEFKVPSSRERVTAPRVNQNNNNADNNNSNNNNNNSSETKEESNTETNKPLELPPGVTLKYKPPFWSSPPIH